MFMCVRVTEFETSEQKHAIETEQEKIQGIRTQAIPCLDQVGTAVPNFNESPEFLITTLFVTNRFFVIPITMTISVFTLKRGELSANCVGGRE